MSEIWARNAGWADWNPDVSLTVPTRVTTTAREVVTSEIYGAYTYGSLEGYAVLDESVFTHGAIASILGSAKQALQLEGQLKEAFGYTERVSEVCERLEKVETMLSDIVRRLDRQVFSQPSLWVPIESFEPEPYEVLKPFTAVVTPVEDGFEAAFFGASLFASGDTEEEAMTNLKSVVLDAYEALNGMSDSQLGPGPLRQKQVLRKLIRKIGD